MYKVTNKFKDIRRFRDNHRGKTIYVNPKEMVFTTSPPEEDIVWKVELVEEKKIKIKKEVDE